MTGETLLANVEQCLAGFCLSCVVVDRLSTTPCAVRNAESFSEPCRAVAVGWVLFVVSIPICFAIGRWRGSTHFISLRTTGHR
jgi:hypothetical protein